MGLSTMEDQPWKAWKMNHRVNPGVEDEKASVREWKKAMLNKKYFGDFTDSFLNCKQMQG